MDSKTEILYIDETSTNLWELKNKIWQPRNPIIPMSYTLQKTRGSNVAVIGAISNKESRIYYKIGETTNIDNFFEFLMMLNENKKINNKLLVMDNHKAYHNKEIIEYIKSKGGEVLFMPPSSSYFNPIETIWSSLK